MRPTLVVAALTAALLAAVPWAGAAPGGGRDDGPRLLAKRSGGVVCLTYVGGDRARVRACLRPAAADTIRLRHRILSCGGRPPGLFGIAPEGTRKVNIRFAGTPRPVRLRIWRLPRRIHPAGGTAFVVRRNVDGRSVVLTAYGADGGRLAQLRRPFPIPACPADGPRTPRPGG